MTCYPSLGNCGKISSSIKDILAPVPTEASLASWRRCFPNVRVTQGFPPVIVRHAYFLGANDFYKSLKTTLKAAIDREAWESLHSNTSRLFDRPSSGRIAVKVINHLGDEVMKVFRV